MLVVIFWPMQALQIKQGLMALLDSKVNAEQDILLEKGVDLKAKELTRSSMLRKGRSRTPHFIVFKDGSIRVLMYGPNIKFFVVKGY